jgi:hypothetical protein
MKKRGALFRRMKQNLVSMNRLKLVVVLLDYDERKEVKKALKKVRFICSFADRCNVFWCVATLKTKVANFITTGIISGSNGEKILPI